MQYKYAVSHIKEHRKLFVFLFHPDSFNEDGFA
jgi:hypothetical protein